MKIVQKEIKPFITKKVINYKEAPVINASDYKKRINTLLELSKTKKITHIIVYGDREHFSNMFFLTGFDPRFEEAILILRNDEIPTIVVGNEGWDYSNIIPFEIKKELFQSFSLIGQPRGKSKSLKNIFELSGINKNSKIGIIGWKYFSSLDLEDYELCIEIPHYLIEVLIGLADRKNIVNVNDFMVSNDYGIRHKLDAKELILHEIAGTKVSKKVFEVINGLTEGISEIEASQYFNIDGDPLSLHPNVNFGTKHCMYGLASPDYYKKLAFGDLIAVGLGYRRGLTHRAGIYARDKKDISVEMEDITEYLFKPYFKAIVVWYESIFIGATGDEIFNNVKNTLGSLKKYGIVLNLGHQIHTEEWTNSLFYNNSKSKLASGMVIQCDIISSHNNPPGVAHVEDGLILADNDLKKEIQMLAPESWGRIIARRNFMKETIGINLSDEVLPTSDLQGVLFPYMANTQTILAKE